MMETLKRKGTNLVPVVLALVPFVGLVILSLAACCSRLRPGSGAAVFFLSLVALSTAGVSLSKVRAAPFLVYGAIVVAFFGKWGLDAAWVNLSASAAAHEAAGYGGSGTWWLMVPFAIAAFIALMRQDRFIRPWIPRALHLFARQELLSFVKPVSSAPRRALIAAILVVIAFVVIGFAMPDINGEPASAGRRFGCAGAVVVLVSIALGVMATIVQIPDEPVEEAAEDEEPED